ncbi:MAG: hypothetical protein ABR607_02175 [Pyrinomonadaceae bacterium]
MFETHGFSKVDTARKCFAENLRDFGRGGNNEKYNLYNGLANLAAAVEETQNQVSQLHAMVAALLQRLQ